jgi:hypothetical protein
MYSFLWTTFIPNPHLGVRYLCISLALGLITFLYVILAAQPDAWFPDHYSGFQIAGRAIGIPLVGGLMLWRTVEYGIPDILTIAFGTTYDEIDTVAKEAMTSSRNCPYRLVGDVFKGGWVCVRQDYYDKFPLEPTPVSLKGTRTILGFHVKYVDGTAADLFGIFGLPIRRSIVSAGTER